MKRSLLLLALALLLAAPALAQDQGGWMRWNRAVSSLEATCTTSNHGGEVVGIRDGASPVDCGTGLGAFKVSCACLNVGGVGTWVAVDLSTSVGGTAAGVVFKRLGSTLTEGYETFVVDETLLALAAISTDLTADVPAGAVILSVQGNVDAAITGGGTSVNVCIGTTGNPDLRSPTVGALTLDAKIDHIPAYASLASAEDLQVHMCTAAGAIGDTAASGGGAFRVRIVYANTNSLDDA